MHLIFIIASVGFFDFYIIPLAKKLKDCGVFGVASDEYLNYALMNRDEWEQKGRDIVDGYVQTVKKLWDPQEKVEENPALTDVTQSLGDSASVDSFHDEDFQTDTSGTRVASQD